MKIKTIYRNIKTGIKNLIIWLPIIWKDRWWDYTFLYEILRFKLILMEKKFRNYGIHKFADRDADNIKRCIMILNRILDDNYYENFIKIFKNGVIVN